MIWVLSYMMCKCLHCHCNNSLHQEGAQFNRSYQTPHWEEYLQTCILRISMLSVSCSCIVCEVKFTPQIFLRAELFNNIYSHWIDPWHVWLWRIMLISPEWPHFLNIDIFSYGHWIFLFLLILPSCTLVMPLVMPLIIHRSDAPGSSFSSTNRKCWKPSVCLPLATEWKRESAA